MNAALTATILLVLTIVAVVVTRTRAVLIKMAVETALLVAISAFLLSHGSSPLPHPEGTSGGIATALTRAVAVIWWLVGAGLFADAIGFARGRDPKSRGARLFTDITSAVIYITTTMIVLNSVLDLRINGLLATSGVVAIVLGLAMQNTLADLFAGIAVGMDQPFQLG